MVWTAEDIPDLSGKTIVVTGGNSGIGYEAALRLAGKGAEVILACRDPRKADRAGEEIARVYPQARVQSMALDLASLASVRAFAESFAAARSRLDVLINNAGVMALPQMKTADGFEMQLGTNHLGHFALTGLLLETLLATPGSRVVNVSSTAHKPGRIRFADLQWERGYQRWFAYAQSKLANLLFTYELQRRLEAKGAQCSSVACHPGYAATNLQTAAARIEGSRLMERFWDGVNGLLAQSSAMGALPTLRAATDPAVRGGEYYGPAGLFESRGYPVVVKSSRRSHDREAAAKLWSISADLTGVTPPL